MFILENYYTIVLKIEVLKFVLRVNKIQHIYITLDFEIESVKWAKLIELFTMRMAKKNLLFLKILFIYSHKTISKTNLIIVYQNTRHNNVYQI